MLILIDRASPLPLTYINLCAQLIQRVNLRKIAQEGNGFADRFLSSQTIFQLYAHIFSFVDFSAFPNLRFYSTL